MKPLSLPAVLTAVVTTVVLFLETTTAFVVPSHRQQRQQQQPSPSSLSIQAGAIFSAPANDSITSITGTFRVPTLSIPIQGPLSHRAPGIYAFSLSVGIGGYPGPGSSSLCPPTSSALRAGIDVFYNGFADAPMAPYAWYQYGPASAQGAFAYAGFVVEDGDLVRVTVDVTGEKGVDVVMENFGKDDGKAEGRTAGQKVPPTFGLGDVEALVGGLCRSEAAWVLEDHLDETGGTVPVAVGNFTEVVFGEMKVTTAAGGMIIGGDGKGVKVVDLEIGEQGGKLTECTAGMGEVRCKRVPGGQ
ncbi:Aspergillopepsin-2 [Echria macrotheca]|uniref:Aspergillopepsin-2 n=1 Tax=Echria macrotheca TaxID=438768 RepID=A0AAJ0FF50_9PEZI|nr:Aspergillopepsin-2 [Echria macrotheca]